jgi:transcriptional regulator with XRE-family HTH domain
MANGRDLLLKFLEDRKLSQADFSRLSGITTGMVCHYLTDDAEKRRRPGLEHAHAIERVTDGRVPAESWISSKPRKSRSGRTNRAA